MPPETARERFRGRVRLLFILLMTLPLLLVFTIGRGLQMLLGRWVGFHYPIARFWSRMILVVFGIGLKVTGKPIRKGGVLVANHASWVDIVALRAVTRINFVSKAEVRDWPGVGIVAALCETVFIERKRTAAKKQQEDLHKRISANELLCIFPEGTSTDGLRVLPFKSTLMSVLFMEGVHETAMVQPVSLVYRTASGIGLPQNFYGWWGSMAFESHVWTVATRSRGGQVEVVFHEPMRASDWENRKALTAHCEAAVRSALPSLPEEG